jgi:hypothetical protein
MMGRRGFGRTFGVVLLAGLTVVVLSGCGLIWPSDRMRHRITVEIDTPQGVRTGVSVIETTATEGSTWGGNGPGIHFSLKGDAVALDLGGGRTLFALLRGAGGSQGDGAGFQARLMTDALRAGTTSTPALDVSAMDLMQARAAVKDAEATLDLPQGLYPMLVTFTDIADPKSVTRVEPADLAATFGPGVKLRRITVAVTDAAVTRGIGKRLGWLDKMEQYDFRKDGPFYKSYPSEVTGLRSK